MDGLIDFYRRRWRILVPTFCVILVIVIVGSWLDRGEPVAPVNSYASCREAGYLFTDTNPPSCTDGAHTYLGTYVTPTPTPPPISSVPFDVLVDGDSEGVYAKSQQVITDQSHWQAFWNQVHASLKAVPPILTQDFTTTDVIALTEGRQPTTGYDLTVTSIGSSSTGSTVNVTESVPTVTCKVADTPSNRYYIISTTKLVPPISFNITSSPHQCQ